MCLDYPRTENSGFRVKNETRERRRGCQRWSILLPQKFKTPENSNFHKIRIIFKMRESENVENFSRFSYSQDVRIWDFWEFLKILIFSFSENMRILRILEILTSWLSRIWEFWEFFNDSRKINSQRFSWQEWWEFLRILKTGPWQIS